MPNLIGEEGGSSEETELIFFCVSFGSQLLPRLLWLLSSAFRPEFLKGTHEVCEDVDEEDE